MPVRPSPVRFLKDHAQAFQREDAELARRRTADQALHDTVVAFLNDWRRSDDSNRAGQPDYADAYAWLPC